MIRSVLITLILISHAFSDSCEIYTFEEGFEVLFTSNMGVCADLPEWNIGRFEDTYLTDHNEYSTKFIYPQQNFSCITSFPFAINPGGVIEVNIFMEAAAVTDQIHVLAMKYVSGGNDAFVGQVINTPALPDSFVSGWQTLKMTVIGSSTDMIGYVSTFLL